MANYNDWQHVLQLTYEVISSKGNYQHFKSAVSNALRVRWCSDLFSDENISRFIKDFHCQNSASQKSKERSISYRQKGNVLFKKELYNDAVSCYTQSVLTAPYHNQPSECSDVNFSELALAYGNRSAALLRLGENELAVMDCDRALNYGYPKSMAYKVLQRKGQCLLNIGQATQAETVLRQALDVLHESASIKQEGKAIVKTELEKLVHLCSVSSSVKESPAPSNTSSGDHSGMITPSCVLPGPSRSIGLRQCEDRGRYLVAEVPVTAGDLVIREEPFAAVLASEYHTTHCHRCCRRTLNPIPCLQCTEVQYCSDQCLQMADVGNHWLECGHLEQLNALGSQGWLSLRMLLGAKHWCNVQHVIQKAEELGVTASRVSSKPANTLSTPNCQRPQRSQHPPPYPPGSACTYNPNDDELLTAGAPRDEDAPFFVGTSSDERLATRTATCSYCTYQAVYHLMPHTENLSVQELFNMTMTSLLLAKSFHPKLWQSQRWRQSTIHHTDASNPSCPYNLTAIGHERQNTEDVNHRATSTKYPSCGSSEGEHQPFGLSDAEEVAAVLLRHVQQLKCNAQAVTIVQADKNSSLNDPDSNLSMPNTRCGGSLAEPAEGTSGLTGQRSIGCPLTDRGASTVVDTTRQVRLATAVYPTASLMNHACDPNVIASFDGGVLFIRAIKDIEIDGEILHCYGPHFKHMSKEDRQRLLQEQYFFTCHCEACQQTTPSNDDMDWSISFGCSVCGQPLMKKSGQKNVGQCSSHKCRNREDLGVLGKEKQRAANLFKLSQHFMECKHIEECLGILHQCYNIQRSILYKHHTSLAETQDCIAKCYALIGEYKQSAKYLQLSIATVEKRFGPSSIELANELHKLAQIYFNGGAVEVTLQVIDRAIHLLTLHYGSDNQDVRELVQMKECVLSTGMLE